MELNLKWWKNKSSFCCRHWWRQQQYQKTPVFSLIHKEWPEAQAGGKGCHVHKAHKYWQCKDTHARDAPESHNWNQIHYLIFFILLLYRSKHFPLIRMSNITYFPFISNKCTVCPPWLCAVCLHSSLFTCALEHPVLYTHPSYSLLNSTEQPGPFFWPYLYI